jgi:pentalenene oxygenase
MQILCKTLFDLDLGARLDRASEVIDLILDAIDERVLGNRRLLGTKDLRLAWGLVALLRLLNQTAKERHRNASPGADLLTSLARMPEGSPAPDDAKIRRVVIPLFFAGHETTAMCLAWTLLLLARHPDAQQKVADEIEECIGDEPLEPAHIGRLSYLGNVFSESLRIYPPAWGFGRKLMQDDVLAGHELPAGTIVWCSPWVMQRDPRWFDRPSEFIPERWQGDLHRRIPKGTFVPFGSGSRRCLGNTFATWEVALTLATFVRRWRFTIEPGTVVVPTPSMTLRAKSLHLTVHAR